MLHSIADLPFTIGSVAIAMTTQRWGENLLLAFNDPYSKKVRTGENTDTDNKERDLRSRKTFSIYAVMKAKTQIQAIGTKWSHFPIFIHTQL